MWLPERLNVTGANKLLKQIEEPYPDTIFILVSNKPAEILPTIYSRTQRLQLKRLPDHVVARYLSDNFSVDLTDATALAHIAEGNMISAVNSLSLSKENQSYLDSFMSLMRLAYQRNVKELREWASEVAALGRESELRFLEYCQRLIRENFIYNLHITELNYLNRDEAAFSRNFARFINERNVLQIADLLDKAAIDIAGNANGKIVMFDLAVHMILLLKQ